MVSAVQSGQSVNLYQVSPSVPQGSNSASSASLPQDTVTLSEKMQDTQSGPQSNAKGSAADVDHDGDSH